MELRGEGTNFVEAHGTDFSSESPFSNFARNASVDAGGVEIALAVDHYFEDIFFEEGITGYVPHLGSIYDKLPVVLQILSATLATAGCRTIEELHQQGVLEMQSPSALMDSQVHDIVPVNIDQQIL